MAKNCKNFLGHKICFLGFGAYAQKNHFNWIQSREDCSVVGISLDLEMNKRKLKDFNGIPYYFNPRLMLSECKPDIAIVSTPNALHYEHVKLCLEHNLHVLVDKPLACSSSEAQELIYMSKDINKHLIVGLERRYDDLYIKARNIVQTGKIGKIKKIEAHYLRTVNPLFYDSWRNNIDLSGGGVFLDTGSHIVDIVFWITNLKVQKIISAYMTNGNMEVEKYFDVEFEFDEIGSGKFTFEYHENDSIPKNEEIILYGTSGQISLVNKTINNQKQRLMEFNYLGKMPQKLEFKNINTSGQPLADLVSSINNNCSPRFLPDSVISGIEFISNSYKLAEINS